MITTKIISELKIGLGLITPTRGEIAAQEQVRILKEAMIVR